MPISEESNKISYNTNGLIREFSFNFKFLQPSNIKVSFWPKDDKDNSTKSVELEEGRDYTLIYDDAEEGGFVVLTESSAEEQAQGKPKYPATPTSGTLLVARIMPLDQQAHIRPVSGFPEEVITNTFDKLVMIDQQQQEQLDRCVKVSDVSDINPEVLVQQVERIHAGIEDIVVVADHIEDVEYIAANGEDILKASEDSLANVNAAKEQANIATEQAARAESYSQSCYNMLEDSREARDVATEQAGISTAQASVAAEQANIATEQANIVKEQKIIVEQLSQATNDIFLEAQSIEQKVSQDLEVSKGYAQTAIAQANIATEQAGIATTQADIATARADEIKQYAANASISEANALNYASEASASAYNSEISERASATSATNSKIWAEGTDEEVQALGGLHSSKTWAEIGSDVGGKWGNILGDIEDQTDLQTALDGKQDTLTAGENITIENGVISSNGVDLTGYIKNKEVMSGAISIGNTTSTVQSTTVGGSAYSAKNGSSFGYNSRAEGQNSVALGYKAQTTGTSSIQIGEGTNTTANSLQVNSYPLMNLSTGKIYADRLEATGANVDLSNLSSEGEKHFLNKTQITNCLLEVPQNIKLELKDGVLTLKAGSKVIVPNGVGVFEEITISNDLERKVSTTQGSLFIYVKGALAGGAYLGERAILNTTSGETNPATTQSLWYDIKNNKIMSSISDTTFTDDCSFPICIYTNGQIDQVFNGFGYIGSTIWADKGIKCLIPNGRNEDGSLKNVEFTTSKFITRTFPDSDTFDAIIGIGTNNEFSRILSSIYSYNVNENKNTNIGEFWGCAKLITLTETKGVISNFQPKRPFRAVDYNDKSEISNWGMPSNKYIDLTLGATGTTYTAPANGWVLIDKQTSSGKNIVLWNLTKTYGFSVASSATFGQSLLLPVSKGDVFKVDYTATGTTNYFRFIYAQGEV